MADVKIEIQGLYATKNYFIALPNKLIKEINKVQNKWCSDLQKSMKLRAPRISGDFAASIKVIPSKNKPAVEIYSPYLEFTQRMWKPHWIHADMNTRTGKRVGDVLGKEGFIFVKPRSPPSPFIQNSFEMMLNKLPNMLEQASAKAVQE